MQDWWECDPKFNGKEDADEMTLGYETNGETHWIFSQRDVVKNQKVQIEKDNSFLCVDKATFYLNEIDNFVDNDPGKSNINCD